MTIRAGSKYLVLTGSGSDCGISNATMENLYVVIRKKERKLEVFYSLELTKSYKIALGCTPWGAKEIEGDGKTPEGIFYVFAKNPESKFTVSLGISYPGLDDAKRGICDKLVSREEYDEILKANAEKRMPPQKTRLGGEIYIHGGGTESDWTDGCIALKNEEMQELFDAIPLGTQIEIVP